MDTSCAIYESFALKSIEHALLSCGRKSILSNMFKEGYLPSKDPLIEFCLDLSALCTAARIAESMEDKKQHLRDLIYGFHRLNEIDQLQKISNEQLFDEPALKELSTGLQAYADLDDLWSVIINHYTGNGTRTWSGWYLEHLNNGWTPLNVVEAGRANLEAVLFSVYIARLHSWLSRQNLCHDCREAVAALKFQIAYKDKHYDNVYAGMFLSSLAEHTEKCWSNVPPARIDPSNKIFMHAFCVVVLSKPGNAHYEDWLGPWIYRQYGWSPDDFRKSYETWAKESGYPDAPVIIGTKYLVSDLAKLGRAALTVTTDATLLQQLFVMDEDVKAQMNILLAIPDSLGPDMARRIGNMPIPMFVAEHTRFMLMDRRPIWSEFCYWALSTPICELLNPAKLFENMITHYLRLIVFFRRQGYT